MPKQSTTARGSRSSTARRTRLAVPSSAFTESPPGPVIDFGSAKKARYSSDGASTTRSGPGIGRIIGVQAGRCSGGRNLVPHGADRPPERHQRQAAQYEADPHQQGERGNPDVRARDDDDSGGELEQREDHRPESILGPLEGIHEVDDSEGDEPDADQERRGDDAGDRVPDEDHTCDHAEDAEQRKKPAILGPTADRSADFEAAVEE